jgi:predicted ester cyclase
MTAVGHGRMVGRMSNDSSDTERHKSLVRDWFRMFTVRDPVEVTRLASEIAAEAYIEHAIAPFGQAAPGLVHGPSHLVEASTWLLAQFPDIEMSVEAMVMEGGLGAALVRSTGTNLGPLNGVIPPTGRPFDAHQSHWFRIRDGQIAEHWATRDDLRAMIDLGVIPKPGSRQSGPSRAASTVADPR